MTNFNRRLIPWIQSRSSTIYEWDSEINSSFRERMGLAYHLLVYCEDSDNEQIKNAARKNALVSMVSAFDVYCRDLIINWTGSWLEDGIISLLKKKNISGESLTFLQGTDITKEALVARCYSFQSVEVVASVFGRLMNCDFLKFIDEAEYIEFENDFPLGWYSFSGSFPEWRKTLVALFYKRHKIVHEANMFETLTTEELTDYYSLLSALPYAMNWAFFEWYQNSFGNDDDLDS